MLSFSKFGLFSLNLGEERLQFVNIVELFEKVLPFEWNSFCISLSSERVSVIHNGKIQGKQNLADGKDGDHLKRMTRGTVGGAKFTGMFSDLQIFSKEISDSELQRWTECQSEVNNIY